MNKIKNVLFICYANICRSPAAEILGRFYAKKYDVGLKFDSAGWHTAFPTAVKETKDYAESKGIDMVDFKSKLITQELLENADLIIGMEKYHLLKARKTYKEIREKLKPKLFTLKQFNGAERKEVNIPDPYNTGEENYRNIMRIVDSEVEKLVLKIKEINSKWE